MSALVWIIFIVVSLLAAAIGAAGGYYYYRARHREAMVELEALDQDLREREDQLRKIKYEISPAQVQGRSDEPSVSDLLREVEHLKEQLEQRELDMNILRQDYDLETKVLKEEVDQLRAEKKQSRRDELAAIENEKAEIGAARSKVEARHLELQEKQEALEQERTQLTEHAQRLSVLKGQLESRQEQLQEQPRPANGKEESKLVKRLRQQIKLQEDELEHLRAHTAAPRPRPRRSPAIQLPTMSLSDWAAETPPDTHEDTAFPRFSPISSLAGSAPSAGTSPPPAPARDALTELTGVDAGVQQRLASIGITRFEQIARWSSADVRRVAEVLQVNRDLVQNHWIIEAQSRMFDRS